MKYVDQTHGSRTITFGAKLSGNSVVSLFANLPSFATDSQTYDNLWLLKKECPRAKIPYVQDRTLPSCSEDSELVRLIATKSFDKPIKASLDAFSPVELHPSLEIFTFIDPGKIYDQVSFVYLKQLSISDEQAERLSKEREDRAFADPHSAIGDMPLTFSELVNSEKILGELDSVVDSFETEIKQNPQSLRFNQNHQ